MPEQRAAYLKKNDITPPGQDKKELKQIAEELKNRTGPSMTQGSFTFKYNGKQSFERDTTDIELYRLEKKGNSRLFSVIPGFTRRY